MKKRRRLAPLAGTTNKSQATRMAGSRVAAPSLTALLEGLRTYGSAVGPHGKPQTTPCCGHDTHLPPDECTTCGAVRSFLHDGLNEESRQGGAPLPVVVVPYHLHDTTPSQPGSLRRHLSGVLRHECVRSQAGQRGRGQRGRQDRLLTRWWWPHNGQVRLPYTSIIAPCMCCG